MPVIADSEVLFLELCSITLLPWISTTDFEKTMIFKVHGWVRLDVIALRFYYDFLLT